MNKLSSQNIVSIEHKNLSDSTLTELIDYIEQNQRIIKEHIFNLQQLLCKIINIDKEHNLLLATLQEAFITFKIEADVQLTKEMETLIPYVREIESYQRNGGTKPKIPLDSLENPNCMAEYDYTEKVLLKNVLDITTDYLVPENASNTFKALYESFRKLEKKMHEHIYLVNDLFLPKVIELEMLIMHDKYLT